MSEVNDLIRENARLYAELAEIKKIHTDLMLVTNNQLAEVERLRAALKYYAGFTAPSGKVYPPLEDHGLLARTTLEANDE